MTRGLMSTVALAAAFALGAASALAGSLRPLPLVGVSEQCPTNENWRNVRVRACFCSALAQAGCVPVVVPRHLTDAEMEALVSRLDALVLSGGEDVDPARYGAVAHPKLGTVNRVRDEFEWRLLAAAVRRRLPLLGICRGCQLLNAYFGGTLVQDIASERPSSLTHRGTPHPLMLDPDSRLARVLGTTNLTINSYHHQAVKDVAPGFSVKGRAPDGVVEVIESRSYPAVGLQFHPEKMVHDDGNKLLLKVFSQLGDLVE